MNSPLLKLIVRWLVLALGVTLAEKIVPGIDCKDGVTLFVVVVLLSFFNAVLRPILVLFTLPFIVLTMGLGLVVLNALLFMLVGKIVSGFTVEGFWSAVGGALIVGVTNLIMTILMKQPPGGGPGGGGGVRGSVRFSVNRGGKTSAQASGGAAKELPKGKGDVIDV
jgi:putative membrane protein